MNFSEIIKQLKHGPTDVVGIDVGTSSVKAVRIKATDSETELVSAEIMPAVKNGKKAETDSESDIPAVEPLNLSRKVSGRYASIALTGENAVVKLLNFPGQFTDDSVDKLIQGLGLENPNEYRIGYKLITQAVGKNEAKVLAVAIPEVDAAVATDLLPSGLPAPFSIEVSGLATMTAFLHGPAADFKNEALGVIDFGSHTTSFGLFNKNVLALIRRFNLGTNSVLNNVQKALGVDSETAQGIIADGAFDISQSVIEVMDPILKQLIVCRDFVERREDCRVTKIFVTGGLALSSDSIEEMHSSLGVDVETWNPLDYVNTASDAVPEPLAGSGWRFTAAIGAALATLEKA